MYEHMTEEVVAGLEMAVDNYRAAILDIQTDVNNYAWHLSLKASMEASWQTCWRTPQESTLYGLWDHMAPWS